MANQTETPELTGDVSTVLVNLCEEHRRFLAIHKVLHSTCIRGNNIWIHKDYWSKFGRRRHR